MNKISPQKIIQTREDNLASHSKETRDLKEGIDEALKKAITIIRMKTGEAFEP